MNKWRVSTVKTKAGLKGLTNNQKKLEVVNAFQERKKFQEEISNFFSETSFTALTRIYKAESIFHRLAWTIVVLAMMAWLAVQCYWLLERYFRYPIEVKLDLKAAPQLDFPSVTICNLNPILERHLKNDPYKDLDQYSKPDTKDTLFTATLNSWMFNESCTWDQYMCSNGRCIPTSFLCDSYDDCGNNDDEQHCSSHSCSATQFKCADNSTCRPLSYKCDGYPDCPQGDDEENCTTYSSPSSNTYAWTTERITSDTSDGGSSTDHPNPTSAQTMQPSQDVSTESSPLSGLSSTTQDTHSSVSTQQVPSGRRKREAHVYNQHRSSHTWRMRRQPLKDEMARPKSTIRKRLQSELARHQNLLSKQHTVSMVQDSFINYIETKRRIKNKKSGYSTNQKRRRRSTKSEEKAQRSQFDIDWDKVLSSSAFNKWDALSSPGSNFYAERDDEWEASTTYAYITAKLNETFVENSGHLIKNMIASCEFNGYRCSPSNFTFFHNHKYGNCYTFNSLFSDNPKLTTRFQGPGYGLKMQLFLNQKEYVANLAAEAGIKVLIHKRGSMPFPEDKGITIMPGRSTSVGMREVRFSRLPPPHGICSKKGDIPDFYNTYVGTTYSKLSCLKSCYQQNIIEECGCAVPFYFVPPEATVCNMLINSTEWCVTNLPNKYADRFSACDQKCPQPCEETEYDLSVSSSEWPSEKYDVFLAEKLSQTNSLYADSDTDDDFTKIQIYFQDLIYTYIDQQKAYESMNLISDLGGQLGLWLGLSAITIGELCSLLFSVGRSLPNTWLGSTKTTPSDVIPISKIEPATLEDMYDDLCPEQAKYIPPDIIKTKLDFDNTKESDI